MEELSDLKAERRSLNPAVSEGLVSQYGPYSTAVHWRVIVQSAVIHHVSPHTEGDRLAVGLLYGQHSLLLAVGSRLASRATPTAQTGPDHQKIFQYFTTLSTAADLCPAGVPARGSVLGPPVPVPVS